MSDGRKERRPKLGSWHTITEKAKKVRHNDVNPTKVQWHAFDIKSVKAMYVGHRTKFNGHLVRTELFDWEDYISNGFIQDEVVEVWLFVVYAHQNPIEVFPFDYPDDK